MAAIKADENLQGQLESAEDAKSIVKLAKAAGFLIVEDETVAFLSSYHDDEAAQASISDEELEFVVAAGKGGAGSLFKLLSKGISKAEKAWDLADQIVNRDTSD